jgi:hypothetical protein
VEFSSEEGFCEVGMYSVLRFLLILRLLRSDGLGSLISIILALTVFFFLIHSVAH